MPGLGEGQGVRIYKDGELIREYPQAREAAAFLLRGENGIRALAERGTKTREGYTVKYYWPNKD